MTIIGIGIICVVCFMLGALFGVALIMCRGYDNVAYDEDLMREVCECAKEWAHLELVTGIPIYKDDRSKVYNNLMGAIRDYEEWSL